MTMTEKKSFLICHPDRSPAKAGQVEICLRVGRDPIKQEKYSTPRFLDSARNDNEEREGEGTVSLGMTVGNIASVRMIRVDISTKMLPCLHKTKKLSQFLRS